MQDTQNLIKKRDKYLPKKIREAYAAGDAELARFYADELGYVQKRIDDRAKGRLRMKKQYRKKYGHN